MATYENDVLIQRKQGADTHIDYPVTRYANVLDAPVIYNNFADVDAAYTNDTLFATVYNAMAANSVLRTPVTANATDYPANGLLEVIKQDANHGACTLSAADGVYTLNITPNNIEQIFGGGALNKWSKTAREADLTALSGVVDGVSDKIGTSADDNEQQTVFGSLNEIANTTNAILNNGVIKSTQRGSTLLGPGASRASAFVENVTINPVDINKSIVLFRGHVVRNDGTPEGYDYWPSGWLTSSTTLRIGAYTWGNTYAYWQVIEFY